MTFPVLNVTEWQSLRLEQRGATTKDWVLPPHSPAEEPEWLWKQVATESSGLRRALGHDWGERVAGEVAGLLGVPAATVELAVRGDQRGVICRSFASHRAGLPALTNASEILGTVVPGYDGSRTGQHPDYTLEAVFELLAGVEPPAGSNTAITNGQEAFAGVLLLDAIIANQDRHHDNWGLLQAQDGATTLTPAFDQACSLGYQATQTDKERRLQEGSVQQWAARGRATQFATRPRLVKLAVRALERIHARAAEHWIARLEALSLYDIEHLVRRVPAHLMSHVDRRFATEIVRVNRERTLDAWSARGE